MDDQQLDPTSYKILQENNSFIEIETQSQHQKKDKCYKMKYNKNNGTIILSGLMGGADFELYPSDEK